MGVKTNRIFSACCVLLSSYFQQIHHCALAQEKDGKTAPKTEKSIMPLVTFAVGKSARQLYSLSRDAADYEGGGRRIRRAG